MVRGSWKAAASPVHRNFMGELKPKLSWKLQSSSVPFLLHLSFFRVHLTPINHFRGPINLLQTRFYSAAEHPFEEQTSLAALSL